MNKKKLIAGLVAPLAITGLMFSTSAISSGFAAEPEAPVTVAGSTSSSVGTKPQCAWGLSGVESSNTLAGEEGTKYAGEDFSISGSDSGIEVTVTGGDCSWYEYKKGANITITTDAAPKFTINDATDTTMDFDLTELKPLTLGIVEACDLPWSVNNAAVIGDTSVSATPLSISKIDTAVNSTCTYAMSMNATVPAGKSPKNAGSNYALVGPGLTTTLTLTD
jgi:hypothetical protein